jgi:hypothetical protein
MFFIAHTAVPAGRKPTYLRIVAAYKTNKTEKYRTRFTAGGNLVEYEGTVSTPTVDMPTVKCKLNSVVNTQDARVGYFTVGVRRGAGHVGGRATAAGQLLETRLGRRGLMIGQVKKLFLLPC